MTLAAHVPDYDPQAELELAQAELFGGQAPAALRRLEALAKAEPQEVVAAYWLAAARGATGDEPGFKAALREARNDHALSVIAQAGGDLAALKEDPAYALKLAEAVYGRHHVAVASAAYAFAANET